MIATLYFCVKGNNARVIELAHTHTLFLLHTHTHAHVLDWGAFTHAAHAPQSRFYNIPYSGKFSRGAKFRDFLG